MSGKFFALVTSGIFILIAAGCTGTESPGVNILFTSTPSPNNQPSTGLQDESLVRVSDEGGVLVEVTPLNLRSPGEGLDFQISMDTHSVELDYDLLAIATLTDDQGNTYQPTAWDGPRGGHHMSGILGFNSAADILRPGIAFLELELRDIAGVAIRTFRWDL